MDRYVEIKRNGGMQKEKVDVPPAYSGQGRGIATRENPY